MMRKNKSKNENSIIADTSVNLSNLMKIKSAFSEEFVNEKSGTQPETNEETYETVEDRKRKEFEAKFIETIKHDPEENDNFDSIDNVYSSKDVPKSQKSSASKRLKIEKDDLLGWDL